MRYPLLIFQRLWTLSLSWTRQAGIELAANPRLPNGHPNQLAPSTMSTLSQISARHQHDGWCTGNRPETGVCGPIEASQQTANIPEMGRGTCIARWAFWLNTATSLTDVGSSGGDATLLVLGTNHL